MKKRNILLLAALAAACLAAAAVSLMAASEPGLQVSSLSKEFKKYLNYKKGAYSSIKTPGYAPDPLDLSHNESLRPLLRFDSSPYDFIASYDLRTQNRLTPIRDQKDCSSCWMFATIGAIESNLAPGEIVDLSENHIKNSTGFDLEPCAGGNYKIASAYLARHNGPVYEEDDPYDDSSYVSPPGLKPKKIIQSILFPPDRHNSLDNSLLKQMVVEHGAVATNLYYDMTYLNKDTNAYIYTGTEERNHSVNIVGWDDNFPKGKFVPEAPGDGAFIARNSYGPAWGDAGYFYVSYYDVLIGKGNAVFLGAEPPGKYSSVYQYDDLGATASAGFGSETACAANVFTVSGDEVLKAVSFYAVSINTTYEIRIYADVTVSPSTGTLIYNQSGVVDLPGYYVIELTPPTPIKLTTGSKFAAAVKYTAPGTNNPIPVEKPIEEYSSKATANANESFVSSACITWADLTTSMPKSSVTIKAFTVPACDDGNACTDDSASGQTCSHANNTAACSDDLYCTTGDVCASGSCGATILPDYCVIEGECFFKGEGKASNSCRYCDPLVSQTEWSKKAENAPCGSKLDVECDKPDFCGADGECKPNYATKDTACGSDTATECDKADSCDGAGTCSPNYVEKDKPCGSPEDSICDKADSCDGEGACGANIAGKEIVCRESADVCDPAENCDGAGACPADVNTDDGTVCEHVDKCVVNSKCDKGVCKGEAKDCDDGIACTTDSCVSSDGKCKNEFTDSLCDDSNPCTTDKCAIGGCEKTNLDDWTACGESKACFAQTCEQLAANDVCEKATKLEFWKNTEGSLSGHHAARPVDAACGGTAAEGPDAYFYFEAKKDVKYTVTLSSTDGAEYYLAIYPDCKKEHKCLIGKKAVSGSAALEKLAPTWDANLIVQVLGDKGTISNLADSKFTVRVDDLTHADGDEEEAEAAQEEEIEETADTAEATETTPAKKKSGCAGGETGGTAALALVVMGLLAARRRLFA